ncbi:hypothetical protein SCUP234_06370 [Seiridium cupressi]
MSHTSEYYGSIVAFEGSRETVSTQLRLLPNSPRILVLPPLQHFMKGEDKDAPFDARSYILEVHEAYRARIKMAHSFLEDSSPDNKRLVFMNGGAASAHMSCISAIGRHLDNEDTSQAEGTFSELVCGGVAGLRRHVNNSTKTRAEQFNDLPDRYISKNEVEFVRRMSEAMRAADALDQETASLQSSEDIDLTVSSRKRGMTIPLRRSFDDLDESTPFYVFGTSPDSEEATFPQQEILNDLARFSFGEPPKVEPRGDRTLNALAICENSLLHGMVEQASPRYVGEARRSSLPNSSSLPDGISSPCGAMFNSPPTTPAVIYGEARLVDVRTSPGGRISKQRGRIRSADHVYSDIVQNGGTSATAFGQFLSMNHDGDSPSNVDQVSYSRKLPLRSKYNTTTSTATVPQLTKSNTRRQPPNPLDLSKPSTLEKPCVYVNRGTSPEMESTREGSWIGEPQTDAVKSISWNATAYLEDDTPFETVLPMQEDLVIHFKDEKQDTLLDSIIHSFRIGSYPGSMPPLVRECESDIDAREESRPSSAGTSRTQALVHDSASCVAFLAGGDDYDPFASHGSYLQPQSPDKASPGEGRGRGAVVNAPPTPASTPPPDMVVHDGSFHEFQTTDCGTAVCVQNSLRSILNIYFSPEESGYEQFEFSLLPELSSMWKPVFREIENGHPEKEKRKLDLILAIGAQRGVPKKLHSALTGSLEKLGDKSDGTTRSGRLDLRYLIANAMQSYTCLPLAKQTLDNPFTNPLLLATLIIPHLETFLAAHNETRFLLLEYPPEHLSTVIALQRLVGVDILKVAGILGAEPLEPKPIRKYSVPGGKTIHTSDHPESELSTTKSKTSATLLSPKSGAHSGESPPFSKANFLITSSATESEIATLISTIWKILIDISPFYIPDDAPKPAASLKILNNAEYAPLTTAKIMMGFQKALSVDYTSSSAEIKSKNQMKRSSASLKSSRSVKSSKSKKTTHSSRTILQKLLAQETGGEVDRLSTRPSGQRSSYFDVSEDEEGRFYQDERKYMPLYVKKPEVRKGNSRKALKFLGLA